MEFILTHMTADQRASFVQVMEVVVRYISELRNDHPPSMIISSVPSTESGGYGCGKTSLATFIHHNNCAAYGNDVDGGVITKPLGTFISAYHLISQFDEKDFKVIDFLSTIGNLLVIDDLGREGTLKFESRDRASQMAGVHTRYSTIINHCYRSRIPIVITTNLSGSQMEELIGGDGRSRLRQMVPPEYRINMSGIPDYRDVIHQVSI